VSKGSLQESLKITSESESELKLKLRKYKNYFYEEMEAQSVSHIAEPNNHFIYLSMKMFLKLGYET